MLNKLIIYLSILCIIMYTIILFFLYKCIGLNYMVKYVYLSLDNQNLCRKIYTAL